MVTTKTIHKTRRTTKRQPFNRQIHRPLTYSDTRNDDDTSRLLASSYDYKTPTESISNTYAGIRDKDTAEQIVSQLKETHYETILNRLKIENVQLQQIQQLQQQQQQQLDNSTGTITDDNNTHDTTTNSSSSSNRWDRRTRAMGTITEAIAQTPANDGQQQQQHTNTGKEQRMQTKTPETMKPQQTATTHKITTTQHQQNHK